jgi:hypothetical protein
MVVVAMDEGEEIRDAGGGTGEVAQRELQEVKVFAWSDARSNDSLSMAYFFLKEG